MTLGGIRGLILLRNRRGEYTMSARRLFAIQLVVAAFAVSAVSHTAIAVPQAKILTASSGGTYAALANSLREAMKGQIDLEVVLSAGSGENVLMVSTGSADLAMVQLDYLTVLANKPKFKAIMSEIQVLAPLYFEEVHILVRKKAKIKAMSDFKRKRISVGSGASGSFFSAKLLLGEAGLNVTEKGKVKLRHEPPEQGIERLVKGKLDAMFFTGGQPVAVFAQLPAKARKKIQLFGLPSTVIESYKKTQLPYWSATIPAGAYPWAKKAVETVATPCVLITSVTTPPDIIDEVVKAIFANKEALKAKHPKWGQVDLKFAKKLLQMGKLNFHPSAVKYLSTAK